MCVGPQFIEEFQGSIGDLSRYVLEIENYLFWHGVFDICLCLPLIILFKEKPSKYPTPEAQILDIQN